MKQIILSFRKLIKFDIKNKIQFILFLKLKIKLEIFKNFF